MALLKNFFIGLSNNSFLNNAAKKVGPRWAPIKSLPEIQFRFIIQWDYLNDKNIAVTVDNLGEFVGTVEESNHAKEQILTIMDALHQHGVKAHMSVKLSQLGAGIRLRISLPNFKRDFT